MKIKRRDSKTHRHRPQLQLLSNQQLQLQRNSMIKMMNILTKERPIFWTVLTQAMTLTVEEVMTLMKNNKYRGNQARKNKSIHLLQIRRKINLTKRLAKKQGKRGMRPRCDGLLKP